MKYDKSLRITPPYGWSSSSEAVMPASWLASGPGGHFITPSIGSASFSAKLLRRAFIKEMSVKLEKP